MDLDTRAKELSAIRDNLREGRTVPPITVRTLLSWFNAMRRGYVVVYSIKRALRDYDLVTNPAFEVTYIDGLIEFALAPQAEASPTTNNENAEDAAQGNADHTTDNAADLDDITNWISKDPTYRVSRLQAATQQIAFVNPSATLTEVVTRLLSERLAQLPVMTSPRDVKGIISWKSIGLKLSLGTLGTGVVARDVMEPHKEIRFDDSIFDAIPTIVEAGYVLIRDNENKISGILTANDLGIQFRKLTEPFLLLSEIENLVRNMIGNRFSKSELTSARDPGVEIRPIEDVSDLTFGEYVRLLQNPDRWSQLGIAVDRKIFCDKLNRIRQIRNDVTHFDPDGISETELYELRDFASFLKELETTLRFSNPTS